jgi:predicted GNAT family acetyltransferase
MVDNAAARAAYERMGFVVHHDYEYRTVQTTLRAPDA